jgi:hypothetical protein
MIVLWYILLGLSKGAGLRKDGGIGQLVEFSYPV